MSGYAVAGWWLILCALFALTCHYAPRVQRVIRAAVDASLDECLIPGDRSDSSTMSDTPPAESAS